MKHFASPQFWDHYYRLPKEMQQLADKDYALLKQDPSHPSLHLKHIGRFGLCVLDCAIVRWR
jgi:hypothetical protein